MPSLVRVGMFVALGPIIGYCFGHLWLAQDQANGPETVIWFIFLGWALWLFVGCSKYLWKEFVRG